MAADSGQSEMLASPISISPDEVGQFEVFKEVLDELKFDNVSSYASRLRNGGCGSPSVGDHLHGSFNILFPITFTDDTKWLLKVPITGTKQRWNDSAKQSLISEALTMRLLRRRTTIPLPKIIDFCPLVSSESSLGCPFITMDFTDGLPLQDVWFNARLTDTQRTAVCTRALHDVAAAMAQLGQFTYEMGGRPLLEEGEPDGIGSMRLLDHVAMREHSDEDIPSYIDSGPFKDARSFYTSIPELHPSEPKLYQASQ